MTLLEFKSVEELIRNVDIHLNQPLLIDTAEYLEDCIKVIRYLQAELKRRDEALNISKLMLKDIDNKLKADQYLIDDRDDKAVRTIIKQELKRIEQALAEQQREG